MNKRLLSILSVLIIFAFIGYMIYDSVKPAKEPVLTTFSIPKEDIPDMWAINRKLKVGEGTLKAVAVSPAGNIFCGGTSYVACYDLDLKKLWSVPTPASITSIAWNNDTIYASTMDQVILITNGKIINEWGPFEKNSIFTSVSAGRNIIAVADAGNRTVFILDKGGEVKKMIGRNDDQFVIPSAYFDAAISEDNTLYIANTGHRRVEKRKPDGSLDSYFGEAGTAASAFCGCCNPAHLITIPGGFITAEKGINRIKILNGKGEFVEFVTSHNNFVPSIPLDIASPDGKIIYAAYSEDSTIYVYTRK